MSARAHKTRSEKREEKKLKTKNAPKGAKFSDQIKKSEINKKRGIKK